MPERQSDFDWIRRLHVAQTQLDHINSLIANPCIRDLRRSTLRRNLIRSLIRLINNVIALFRSIRNEHSRSIK